MLCRRARKIPAERSTQGCRAGLRGDPLAVVQDVSHSCVSLRAAVGPLCVTVPAAAKAGQGRDSSQSRHFILRRVKQQESTFSLCSAPQLCHLGWASKACQQDARGNSGQKRGTQSVGGTFPVPANKNKPSKGLLIGIQATQKAGTSKLERIPNISLEVQLIECSQ